MPASSSALPSLPHDAQRLLAALTHDADLVTDRPSEGSVPPFFFCREWEILQLPMSAKDDFVHHLSREQIEPLLDLPLSDGEDGDEHATMILQLPSLLASLHWSRPSAGDLCEWSLHLTVAWVVQPAFATAFLTPLRRRWIQGLLATLFSQGLYHLGQFLRADRATTLDGLVALFQTTGHSLHSTSPLFLQDFATQLLSAPPLSPDHAPSVP